MLRSLLIVTCVALPAAVASAAELTFEEDAGPLSMKLNDFGTESSGTGSYGTEPGFAVKDGRLAFYNNSDFGDVGAAWMVPEGAGPAKAFEVSADVEVRTFRYTQGKVGVFAYAQGPLDYSEDFVGLYAFVHEVDATGNRYQFVLVRAADKERVELAKSEEFDLTDGSPDFRIELTGEMESDGLIVVKARLVQGDEDTVEPLTADVPPADRPNGNQFGLRVNPAFNTIEVGFDNVTIEVE
jgi:hypothetical protein